ncbi:hypothetical protein [Dyadobacter pollutisoli]|uniref:Uncharacterized protein n=1 Tax=Dyadobacter pollutisoli TaxID=2910158 RepID=A0A9E8SNM3_9BACT|nr:hypothetical protein [Dyadobacter pollutisoli]WAC14519.1 hypothetical protein ON006_11285 [Dyadobacter pollutisoli]
MKNLFKNVRLGSLYLLVIATMVFSCKKDDEPVPQGNLIFYTNYDQEKFDRIDVIVDGNVLGTLSKSIPTRPECGAAGSPSVVSLNLPIGTYVVSGKRYKGNDLVGNWKASSATVTAEDCKRIRFVD